MSINCYNIFRTSIEDQHQAEPHIMEVVQNMEIIPDQTEELFPFCLCFVTYYVKQIFHKNNVLIHATQTSTSVNQIIICHVGIK
jgi:hypothetical protein